MEYLLVPMPVPVPVITVNDAGSLTDLIRAAQGNKIVHRLLPEGPAVTALCRSISRVGFQPMHPDDNILDGYLRVRTSEGEHLWPIAELLPEMAKYTTLFE